jgi:hypothetical protein
VTLLLDTREYPLIPARDMVRDGDLLIPINTYASAQAAGGATELVTPLHLVTNLPRVPMHAKLTLFGGEQYTSGGGTDYPEELQLIRYGDHDAQNLEGSEVAVFPGASPFVTHVVWNLPHYAGKVDSGFGADGRWALRAMNPTGSQGTKAWAIQGGIFAGHREPQIISPFQSGLNFKETSSTPGTNWMRHVNGYAGPDSSYRLTWRIQLVPETHGGPEHTQDETFSIPLSSSATGALYLRSKWSTLSAVFASSPTGSPAWSFNANLSPS